MNGSKQQLPRIVRTETISHHELIKFMYVYNVSNPIRAIEEVEVYYHEGVTYFAAVIGRVVILMKVLYD